MKLFVFFLVVLLGFSCTDDRDHPSTDMKLKYAGSDELLVLDTLRFDIQSDRSVLGDVYNDSLFLFFEFYGERIFLADKEGRVRSVIRQSGFQDTGYGTVVGGVKFLSDSTFLLLSDYGLFTYNLDGKLKNRFLHRSRIPDVTGNGLYTSGEFKIIPWQNEAGEKGLFTLLDLSTDAPGNSKQHMKESRLIRFINFSEDTSYHGFMPYPKNSIYDTDAGFYHNRYPLFTMRNDDIYVMLSLEPTLYHLTINTLDSINILGKFEFPLKTPEPFSFGSSNNDWYFSQMSDKFNSLDHFQDGLIVSFQQWNPKPFDLTLAQFKEDGRRGEHYNYFLYFIDPIEKTYSTIDLPREYPYLSKVIEEKFYLRQSIFTMDSEPNTENYLVVTLAESKEIDIKW